jgi:hypothetical protein
MPFRAANEYAARPAMAFFCVAALLDGCLISLHEFRMVWRNTGSNSRGGTNGAA